LSGPKVAQHAGHHLHKYVTQRQEYKSGDYVNALKQGFLEFDEAMQKDEQMRDELAGTTAITVFVKNNHLFCANVGDSRAVASVKGVLEPLSQDHKPNNTEESNRINKAGGWVEYNRVNGNLALSRALGDFVFKRNVNMKPEEQMVIALPDVESRIINQDWEFIVLACDGIWDVLTNEEVVEFVRRRIGLGLEPEAICEELMSTCLAPDCQMGGLGCDNMTVILVCLVNGKTYAEYCAQIASTMLPSALSNNSSSTQNGGDGEFEDAQEGNSNSSEEENENAVNGEDSLPLSEQNSK
jgi:protein phosphatase 2C family protein 2/3